MKTVPRKPKVVLLMGAPRSGKGFLYNHFLTHYFTGWEKISSSFVLFPIVAPFVRRLAECDMLDTFMEKNGILPIFKHLPEAQDFRADAHRDRGKYADDWKSAWRVLFRDQGSQSTNEELGGDPDWIARRVLRVGLHAIEKGAPGFIFDGVRLNPDVRIPIERYKAGEIDLLIVCVTASSQSIQRRAGGEVAVKAVSDSASPDAQIGATLEYVRAVAPELLVEIRNDVPLPDLTQPDQELSSEQHEALKSLHEQVEELARRMA